MQAYRYIVNVDEIGKLGALEIPVELRRGKVEVIIVPLKSDEDIDLIYASQSSMNF